MAGYFEAAPDGGAAIALDEVEVSILRSLAIQLLELIGPGPAEVDSNDPFAGLFTDGPTQPPSDPALARLFPDGYGDPAARPDEQARAFSAEFRRYTENELRARKRDDALAVVRSLDALGVRAGAVTVLRLTSQEARHWLGTLNDLRLTLGARLEVAQEQQEGEFYQLPDSDPRKPLAMAYLWFGGLQETLLEVLMS